MYVYIHSINIERCVCIHTNTYLYCCWNFYLSLDLFISCLSDALRWFQTWSWFAYNILSPTHQFSRTLLFCCWCYISRVTRQQQQRETHSQVWTKIVGVQSATPRIYHLHLVQILSGLSFSIYTIKRSSQYMTLQSARLLNSTMSLSQPCNFELSTCWDFKARARDTSTMGYDLQSWTKPARPTDRPPACLCSSSLALY